VEAFLLPPQWLEPTNSCLCYRNALVPEAFVLTGWLLIVVVCRWVMMAEVVVSQQDFVRLDLLILMVQFQTAVLCCPPLAPVWTAALMMEVVTVCGQAISHEREA
jgi:hypothetical protein